MISTVAVVWILTIKERSDHAHGIGTRVQAKPATGKKAAIKRRSFRNRWKQRGRLVLTLCLTASVALGQCGCTTGLVEYVRNGFKVGPNYQRPPVPLTLRWIDQENALVRVGEPNLATWWEVFNDPILTGLIQR